MTFQNEPLALPKGSIRALLSLGLVGSFVVACFWPGMKESALTALAGLAGGVTTHYFQSRGRASKEGA